jgi:hypothetical protein
VHEPDLEAAGGDERSLVSRARDEHHETPDDGGEEQQSARTTELLSAMLDSLGEAHHRPFSRA